jgi:hypothetical protein
MVMQATPFGHGQQYRLSGILGPHNLPYVKSPVSQGEKKYTPLSGLGFGLGGIIKKAALLRLLINLSNAKLFDRIPKVIPLLLFCCEFSFICSHFSLRFFECIDVCQVAGDLLVLGLVT